MYSNKLKDKAWKTFAKFIKLRDSLATTGRLNFCRCITCGNKTYTVLIDAGHCLKGRHNAILFDERATNGQCQYCNRTLGGQYPVYEVAIGAKYGVDVLNEIKDLNKTTVKYSDADYLAKIDYYNKKIELIYNCYKKNEYRS